MALPAATIKRILQGGGELRFNKTSTGAPSHGNVKGDAKAKVWPQYFMAKSAIGQNDITLTQTGEQDATANTVNVVYEADWANCGAIEPPGYVYTDSMSGCVFFLFRGAIREVHGVHASRQSGRLIDPTAYFESRGGVLLHKWDSMGKLTGARQGAFGAVLCCVDDAVIDIFAVALRGRTVEELFEHVTISDWRGASPHKTVNA